MIDVGVEPPRLVIDHAVNSSYVALSYCWGEPQLITLTTQSMSILKDGIDANLLPRTIQDAITVTRRLQQQYLWVDALCVIQDDESTRAQDISTMHDIYANAFLTICASNAGKCSMGFLKNFTELFPSAIRVPIHLPGSTAGTLILRKELSLVRQARTPLDLRAWAYQEAALSPRKLIFDSIVYLECSHTPLQSRWMSYDSFIKPAEYEMFRVTRYNSLIDYDTLSSKLVKVDIFNGCKLSSTLDKAMIHAQNNWKDHVSEYSRRKLTRDDDKLPAFTGLAAEFARSTGFRYLAGLWQETLLVDLLWHVSPPSRCSRLQTRRAPSWSWASVEGYVSVSTVRHLRSYESYSAPYLAELRFVLEVLTVACTPVFSTAIYGENLQGTLRVRGHLIAVHYIGKSSGFGEVFGSRLRDLDEALSGDLSTVDDILIVRELNLASAGDVVYLSAILDTLDDVADASARLHADYWVLPVMDNRGLILSRCSAGVYRRIGHFQADEVASDLFRSLQSTREPAILDII